MGENRIADILVRKPWFICDNNKSCLKTAWEFVDWNFLAGDWYEGHTFMNMIVNFQIV
jgi:hypothetical protein